MKGRVPISRFRRAAPLMAALLSALAWSANGNALERHGPLHTSWEARSADDADIAMYVIGDSLSLEVPYGAVKRAPVWIRGGLGWSTFSHNHRPWGERSTDSFTDAAGSRAQVVFVMLGTNDISCLWGCSFPGTPQTESQRTSERDAWTIEVTTAARKLLDAGKCVVWAGVRENDFSPDDHVEEARAFNRILQRLSDSYPGRFHYADYSSFSFANEQVAHALDANDEHYVGDHVHPQTEPARLAIAHFAFDSVNDFCMRPSAVPAVVEEEELASCDLADAGTTPLPVPAETTQSATTAPMDSSSSCAVQAPGGERRATLVSAAALALGALLRGARRKR